MRIRILNRGFYNSASNKKLVGLAEGQEFEVVRENQKGFYICDGGGQESFFGTTIHRVEVEPENCVVI